MELARLSGAARERQGGDSMFYKDTRIVKEKEKIRKGWLEGLGKGRKKRKV